ncbi:MAG TPA: hypothetical protein VHM91_02265 [Verrucomicrobiales bacterium]|jgi:hypothetical protein|nr:hypothetical protein [Verrucomicrobiales bacterium]
MDDPPYTSAAPARNPDETQVYDVPAAEVPPGMENLTAWDEPPSQTGSRHVTQPPDSDDPAIELVEEGVEEADRELRLEAVTEDEDAVDEP